MGRCQAEKGTTATSSKYHRHWGDWRIDSDRRFLISREEQPEAIHSFSDALMANIYPALMKEVFDVSEREGESDVHHHRRAG